MTVSGDAVAAFWSESCTAADRIATDYSGLNTG